nr:F-box associated interaction domain-containing protein [Tanacetum cinerariifolium]
KSVSVKSESKFLFRCKRIRNEDFVSVQFCAKKGRLDFEAQKEGRVVWYTKGRIHQNKEAVKFVCDSLGRKKKQFDKEKKKEPWIVSLDLANETYGEVLQPVYYGKGAMGLHLRVLGEWLCVLSDYCGNHTDVWVMKFME